MSGVTTLPPILWPLMSIDPETAALIAEARCCVVCGRTYPLNRHHIVRRSAGELYEGGRKLPKPTIMLCGSGNTGGCHGRAHQMMLHFRNDRGCLEYLETEEPTDYMSALEMEGWSEICADYLQSRFSCC